VPGYWACHEQQVGVTWTGDESDAESFEVVDRIVERVDLELAAIAGARVHMVGWQVRGWRGATHACAPDDSGLDSNQLRASECSTLYGHRGIRAVKAAG
jgi:hypothetical protein